MSKLILILLIYAQFQFFINHLIQSKFLNYFIVFKIYFYHKKGKYPFNSHKLDRIISP